MSDHSRYLVTNWLCTMGFFTSTWTIDYNKLWGHAPYSKRLFLWQKTRKESFLSLYIKKRDDHFRALFWHYDQLRTAANMYTTAWHVSKVNSLKEPLDSVDKRRRSSLNIISEIRTQMLFFCWLRKIIADSFSTIAVKMMFNSLDEETKSLPTCLFLKIVSIDLKGHNLVCSKNNLPPPIRF